jgi:hypothetical protein
MWLVNWGRLAGLLVAGALILVFMAVMGAVYKIIVVQLHIGNWHYVLIGLVVTVGFGLIFGRNVNR